MADCERIAVCLVALLGSLLWTGKPSVANPLFTSDSPTLTEHRPSEQRAPLRQQSR